MSRDLCLETLQWAYSSKREMSQRQYREIRSAMREAKHENYESPGRRRSRFWGLGPKWARRPA